MGRFRRVAAGFAIRAVVAVALVIVAVAAYHVYTLPLGPDFQKPERPALTLVAADGRDFATRGVMRGLPVDPDDLPRYLIDALLTMEDRRFHDHHGIDPWGLLRAAFANLAAGGVVQGGSTITQQLARLEYLSAEQTLSRKIQEALIALWLERRLTKQEILARYLNGIYLGAGAYGVEAAARRYFGKPATEVSLAEAAMLVGLIPAPSRYAPTTSLEAARRRASRVLDAMVEAGVISPDDAAAAKEMPATLATPPAEPAGFGHVADWAAAEARRRLDGVTGDFRAVTTIDPSLQSLATDTVRHWLGTEGAQAGATQAALVAMRPDGAVVAMVGGADYAASQFNRAVQARRQPGSAFKLFVYLAALEAGLGPASRVEDAPLRIGSWAPQNYGRHFSGSTTLRTAFARSLNVPAVRVQEQVGRDRVIETARALGITTPLAPDPSLALGTSEVTLIELTAAYAAVQAGRRPVTPYVVTSVESLGDARLTLARPADTVPLAERDALLSLLGEVVRSGTGKAAQLPVAAYGKTGTTQDYRDAWFVGFAGDLTVGVWVGNDDQSPMQEVTGGGLPARIWHAFMAEALAMPRSSEPGARPSVVEPSRPVEVERREVLVGRGEVMDTATLRVAGRVVQLVGVEGMGGRPARDMASYIGQREVSCRPTRGERYRCEVDGWDLSEAVLYNGGGRATATAPPDLVEAERAARRSGRGIWGSQ